MKCYYELLEIERDADPDAIKKNYRKLALKWHPDKNPENIEEATKYFALLQQAYETLSDSQERAWYDRHREQILRGGFDEEFKDDTISILQFHCRCWHGFGDDAKGFFAVYRDVFERLTDEDRDFHDDPKDACYPSFGNSSSDPEIIVPQFYGFWSSFSTVRTFSWLDQYDIRQAPNRPTMRAMEKENEKFRQAAKADRNEQIRELVAFIRKKDPRVVAYKELLEERQAESQKKTEDAIRQRRIDNLKSIGEHKETDEAKEIYKAKMREIEEELDAQYGNDDSGGSEIDEEEEVETPYCVVCEKSFKTMKTKENHERSKAHKQKVIELRKHLKEEDAALLLEGMDEEKEVEAESNNTPRGKKSKKAKKKARKMMENDDDDSANEVNDLVEGVEELRMDDDAVKEEGDEATAEPDNGAENIFLAAAKVPLKREKKKKNKETAKAADQAPEDTGPKYGTCDKCGEFFESRSQLFAHLKETGHATPLAQPPQAKKQKGKKARK